EAYTVMHGRDGEPEQAIATCLLDDGRRAWGLSTEPDVMGALLEGEWVGHRGTLSATGALRVWARRTRSFSSGSRWHVRPRSGRKRVGDVPGWRRWLPRPCRSCSTA